MATEQVKPTEPKKPVEPGPTPTEPPVVDASGMVAFLKEVDKKVRKGEVADLYVAVQKPFLDAMEEPKEGEPPNRLPDRVINSIQWFVQVCVALANDLNAFELLNPPESPKKEYKKAS